jgi:hypothetical protein
MEILMLKDRFRITAYAPSTMPYAAAFCVPDIE